MTLYIEYVILDNLVVDYMLFKLISITTKFKLYKKNLFFACLIGVLSAVFLPYVLQYNYLSVIYRLLSACLMVLVLAKYSYPPVTNDEVFKEILEQAKNYKKYNG